LDKNNLAEFRDQLDAGIAKSATSLTDVANAPTFEKDAFNSKS